MWKSLKELPISDRSAQTWPFISMTLNCFSDLMILRWLASQFLESVSQQRKASSKCWRRRKLRCLLQTPTHPLILLLFLLLPKGRHLLPTTLPEQFGSTCGRNQSSMSMAARVRQGSLQTNLYFSSLSSQVSWWSSQEPWDPVLSGRTWNPSEALSEAHPGHFQGQQCEGKNF